MPLPVDIYAWDNFPFASAVYWCFAIVMLACAFYVVTAKRIFHAGIAMIGCFVCVAGIYALLGAHFMAGLQLLVYVGAIATLLLFAVMLTDKMMEPQRKTTFFQPLLGLIASISMLLVLWLTLSSSNFAAPQPAVLEGEASAINLASLDTANIGLRLLSPYTVPFELISVIILATLIGAAAIARKEDRSPVTASAQAAADAVPSKSQEQ